MSQQFAFVVRCRRCRQIAASVPDDGGKLPWMRVEHMRQEDVDRAKWCVCPRRLPEIERDAEGMPVRLWL